MKGVATMTTFAQRLKAAMQQKGIRACQLSQSTGLSRARISQYPHGKYIPGADGICRIASVLGVSEAWLMGHEEPTSLPDGITPVSLRSYPMLGEIACGNPILAVEEADTFATTSDNIKADFCLIAKGDSMIGARIFDGDQVFIQRTDIVNNGDIAAVVVDDEATLKRVYYYPTEGKLVLKPENPDFQPLIFQGSELSSIHILGKAVAVQASLK